jgi:hypothetical protein
MSPEPSLAALQQWLQAVIVDPALATAEALAAPEAAAIVSPGRLERVVLPSATLTAAERVGVYHEMYVLRMAEALESDYPALAHFLGRERWHDLVRSYVAAHPSRSYTLNALGRHLAQWLLEVPALARRRFCHDLARLEWAIAEAFDAEETPRLRVSELSRVPAQAWPGARLVPSAALRLVALHWNANQWLDSSKGDRHEHPRPSRRASCLAVFRRSYAVYRRELSTPAFRLLSDLASGRPIGRAVAAALRRRDAPDAETVQRWFRDWARDGLFTRVALEP